MRQADLSIAPLAPATATAPARPTAGLGGGNGFGGVFNSVASEVADFIANGDGTAATAAPRLSLEGDWRARGATAGAIDGGVASPAQQAFLDSIAPWAREAAERLGVAPELVSAHAALESGWGQRPLADAAGATSHNLFGIKAGPSWDGAVNEAATTEYVGGAAIATRARFRAYPDQASAFRDYADLLLANPRFRGALGAGADAHAFAAGLARGGYATDPAYADKLAKVAGKVKGISG
jgi:flagellar protein FlgJ